MNIRGIRTSLITRLIALSVFLLVAAAVARYVVIGNFLRQDLIEVFSVQQVALGEAVARDIDYKMDERRQLLKQLAASIPPEFIARPAQLHRWLKERIELQPLFTAGVIAVDPDGKLITTAPFLEDGVQFSVSGDPDFVAARDGAFVVGHVQKTSAETSSLPLFQPIKDQLGAVVAVLIGRTSLLAPGFLDSVQKGRFGKTGSFVVISPRDKLFVVSTQPNLTLRSSPAIGMNPLHDRAMAGYRGTGVTVNSQGVEEIDAIVSVPTTGWFVVARLSTSEALASLSRTKSFLFQFSVLTVLLVICAGGFFGYVQLRPIYNIVRQIRRMARREIPLAELPVTRDDEVGRLAISFNRLLHVMQSDQQDIIQKSLHDPLTGLPNRIILIDRLDLALRRARRTKTRILLLVIDLDKFEVMIETAGRVPADAALKQVVQRLRAEFRSIDTVVRLGSNHLALLAADITEHAGDSARLIAQRCIEAISAPVYVSTSRTCFGVSVGIVISNGMSDPEMVLIGAHAAADNAKKQGDGKFVIAASLDTV